MPQVAKVIAIRNRKICMTRLYLWTKSNTRPTGGTKSEFYPPRPGRRPMMPRCSSLLDQIHISVLTITARTRNHRKPTPHCQSRSLMLLPVYSKYTVPSSRRTGITVVESEFVLPMACLLSPGHCLHFGRPLNQGNP